MVTKTRPLQVSKLKEACVYCSAPADVSDHVIPRRLGEYFNGGWNLVPACNRCNFIKSDDLKIEMIRVPGKPWDDAAVWAVIYKHLSARSEHKQRVLELAQQSMAGYGGFVAPMLFGAFEVYTGEHHCAFWKDCAERCGTHGQLMELTTEMMVAFSVPEGLTHLISGRAAR